MTTRGQPSGAFKAIEGLDAALLRKIKECIDSDKRNSAAAVHRQFDLIGRGIRLRHFQRWVKTRRKTIASRSQEGQPSSDSDRPAPEDLILGLLVERAEARDPKHFASIASALRALCDFRRLGFDDAANRRAEEIHEERMRDVRKRKEAADSEVDRMSVKHGLTEDVSNAIKDLYGIAIDPVTPKLTNLSPEHVKEIRTKVLGLVD